MLWHRFNFGPALLLAVFQAGIPTAALMFATNLRAGPGEVLPASIMAAGGFVAGTLFLLLVWGLGKLNAVRARRRA